MHRGEFFERISQTHFRSYNQDKKAEKSQSHQKRAEREAFGESHGRRCLLLVLLGYFVVAGCGCRSQGRYARASED
jgi:hypothetical protein